MICTQCGYMQADDQIPCRRCGGVFGRSAQRQATGSILDFPGSPRSGNGKPTAGRGPMEVHTSPNVPAWRAELSARVRQIKARRSMEAELEAAMLEHQHQKSNPPGSTPVITVKAEEPELPPAISLEIEPDPQPAGPDEKNENPIVRAMLDRVKRASEQSRSADVPPSVPTPSKGRAAASRAVATNPLVIATATAPATVTATLTSAALHEEALKVPTSAQNIIQEAVTDLAAAPENPAFSTTQTEFELHPPAPPTVQNTSVDHSTFPDLLKELDQVVNHLEEKPEITERLRAGAIDVGTIVLSNIPLWVAVEFVGGNFGDLRVKIILLVASILIAGIYLFGTTTVSGQTFGMMYANLRIVTIQNGQRPNILQTLLRTVGCMVSFFTLMLGFVWAIFDKNQRGLHEHLSGTQVVRA